MRRYGTKDIWNVDYARHGKRLGVTNAHKKDKTSLRMKMKRETEKIER